MSDIYTKTVDKVFEVYHHWATGSRRPWLEDRLQGFHTERQKGQTFAYDFVDKETRVYYTIYHWSLGLKDEPVLPRHDPNMVEDLTEEEAQYKTRHENQMRGVLFRWWDKRASSLDALETSKPNFPLAGLLAEVSGVAAQEAHGPRPRARTAAQLWSKVSFPGSVQDEFAAWFADSDYFNNLLAEVRAPFEHEAEAEKRRTAEMKKGKQGKTEPAGEGESSSLVEEDTPRPSSLVPSAALPLEETARVLDNITAMAYLWIETLGKSLMANVTLLIAGPHPGQGGQIDGVSLNYGWNRDPRPKDWSLAGGGKGHTQAMELFVGFTQTCFTADEIRARAMDKPVETEASSSSGSHSAQDKAVDEAEAEAVTEAEADAATEIEGEKKKPKRPKTKALEDVTNKATPASEPQKKKGPTPSNKRMSSSPPRSAELLPNIDPALQQHLDHFAGGPNDGMIAQDSPRVSPHPSSPVPPAAPSSPASAAAASQPVRTNLSMTTPPFPLTAADLALLNRAIWPEWFAELIEYLEGYKLGERWNDVLGCLMVWEGRGGFRDLKGAKHRHLSEVASWIKFYQRTHPEIMQAGLWRFADEWWSWWKRMQPAWRVVDDVVGPLGDEYRVGLGGDWEVLSKRGQNGHVSPLAALVWWGDSVGDDVDLRREWAWALEECHHTLLNLLAETSE
ncbi:hypothetical protein ARMSODRAFT_1021094 [Armillaria solidipes]|uniref:Uncharacterized protein n=1 Tax=Armillaria solidipes TaxID=1076256 RepID=A0A2H3B704_9AGAR|nr:hypothetical protein ARMSODRAFT_1021094 [Armillaria solidipes]